MRANRSVVLAAASTIALSMAGSALASGISTSQTFASQPASWTAVTSNGGSVSFSNNDLGVYPLTPTNSSTGVNAYETTALTGMTYTTQTGAGYNGSNITTGTVYSTFQFFFNTNDTDTTSNDRGADQGTIYSLFGGGNNALGSIGLSANGYFGVPEWQFSLGNGIKFGGQTVTSQSSTTVANGVTSTSNSSTTGSFNNTGATTADGTTFTVSMATTVTNNGEDPNNTADNTWSITDTISMSNGTDTWIASYTSAEDLATNDSYNPLTSTITFDVGTTSYSDGLTGQYISGDYEYSNLNITQAPEPAVLSLLGLGLIGGLTRQPRRRSRRGRSPDPQVGGKWHAGGSPVHRHPDR